MSPSRKASAKPKQKQSEGATRKKAGDQYNFKNAKAERDAFYGGSHEINYYIGTSPEEADPLLDPGWKPSTSWEPETILIPESSFLMGIKGEDIKDLMEKYGGEEADYRNETDQQNDPEQRKVHLLTYRIGKYPVTNEQYAKFMYKTDRSALEIGWKSQEIPDGKKHHPVTGVSWYDALEYCRWLSGETKRHYILPNEAQWEKACRGVKFALDSKSYPWGDEFDGARCNHGRSELSAVNQYFPQSDYGCFDFVGNVRQWTCSLWGTDPDGPDPEYAYPWSDDDRNEMGASPLVWRVLRGSSFVDEPNMLRCSCRRGDSPGSRGNPGYGFRVRLRIDVK